MGVLRMIKLFGWESHVRDDIANKREEELKYIWKRKILGLLNNISKYVHLRYTSRVSLTVAVAIRYLSSI